MTNRTHNLRRASLVNTDFRKVIHTGISSQHTVMHIEVEKDIGEESHNADQTFIIVKGTCIAIINEQRKQYKEGEVFYVDGGDVHNVINIGSEPLKLISIYSPPIHLVDEINETAKDETKKTIIDTVRLLLDLEKDITVNIIFWDKKTVAYKLLSTPKRTIDNTKGLGIKLRHLFGKDIDTIQLKTDRGDIIILWKEKRQDTGSILIEDDSNYEILQIWVEGTNK